MGTPLALRLNSTVESNPVTASTCLVISMVSRICGLNWRNSIRLRSSPARFATAGDMRPGASAGPWPRMRPWRSVSFDIPLLLSEITACGERLSDEHRLGRDLRPARGELDERQHVADADVGGLARGPRDGIGRALRRLDAHVEAQLAKISALERVIEAGGAAVRREIEHDVDLRRRRRGRMPARGTAPTPIK